MPFFSAHSQISVLKWWHMSGWELPILMMHPIAVKPSENTLMCISSSFMKDFKPRSMAFSSSPFICHCFSSRSQAPPVYIPSHEAPQPKFESSVYNDLRDWWVLSGL